MNDPTNSAIAGIKNAVGLGTRSSLNFEITGGNTYEIKLQLFVLMWRKSWNSGPKRLPPKLTTPS